jgi:drug/metabolite transporter (DMT)-like permease
MKLRPQRQGELSVVSSAVLWGLFPVVTVLSYATLTPLVSLGGSTLFSVLVFAFLLSWRQKWHEVRAGIAFSDILWVIVLNGVLYHVLFFFGLKYTSAGNAAILALTETFFSYLFFHVWRKDAIPFAHIGGSLLMVAGAAVVLLPGWSGIHRGDLLILAASFVAPLGNFFQQRARARVSSETIMFIRTIIVAPAIIILAWGVGEKLSIDTLRNALPVLAVNGILMLGLTKILWIEGIHRVSVTKANALSSISPFVTLFVAWILLGNIPTPWQLFSLAPMLAGVLFLGM